MKTKAILILTLLVVLAIPSLSVAQQYDVQTFTLYATDGYGEPWIGGDYTNTHQIATEFFALDSSSPYSTELNLEFTFPDAVTNETFTNMTINLYGCCEGSGTISVNQLRIWETESTYFEQYATFYDATGPEVPDWMNHTFTDSVYLDFDTNTVIINAVVGSDGLVMTRFVYAECIITTTTTLLSESEEWALNGWYMVFGAGMFIFSTCFAAVKIKSRSGGLDDILIFLVMFILGWGLILTGALS